MGDIFAVHSVGDSLVSYLRKTYPASLQAAHACEFALLSSGEMLKADGLGTTLSLYLYRVSVNEHLRVSSRRIADGVARPLTLDLHYLMTVWADNAAAEQTILAWGMRQLFLHPVLDRSNLTPEGNWDASDTIQIIPAEIGADEMSRIWEKLTPSYRLSVSYIARAVTIDSDPIPEGRPVVASRFELHDKAEIEAGARS